MTIGIPKEIKKYENRVGMTPSGVSELITHKHTVYVETAAGAGSGFTDDEYAAGGAVILNTAAAVWQKSDLIVKVKEPLPPEFPLFHENQTLFIAHADSSADCDAVIELLRARFPGILEIVKGPLGPLIGSHSGPGTLALFFVGKDREA